VQLIICGSESHKLEIGDARNGDKPISLSKLARLNENRLFDNCHLWLLVFLNLSVPTQLHCTSNSIGEYLKTGGGLYTILEISIEYSNAWHSMVFAESKGQETSHRI
jgi:hypothetical protein